MRDGWTCLTDEYATKMMHEPVFTNLVSVHDQCVIT